MITELPKYWFIRITDDTIESVNKFRATHPRAYSKSHILKSKAGYAYEVLVASDEGFGFGASLNSVLYTNKYTELTLKEFRILVVGDLKLGMKDKIKLLKI